MHGKIGSMMRHSTAIIHPNAKLADDVEVGAYSIIGEHVEIAAGSWIGPHVVVEGHTRIGKANRIFQFCSVGAIPQDKKYARGFKRLSLVFEHAKYQTSRMRYS